MKWMHQLRIYWRGLCINEVWYCMIIKWKYYFFIEHISYIFIVLNKLSIFFFDLDLHNRCVFLLHCQIECPTLSPFSHLKRTFQYNASIILCVWSVSIETLVIFRVNPTTLNLSILSHTKNIFRNIDRKCPCDWKTVEMDLGWESFASGFESRALKCRERRRK